MQLQPTFSIITITYNAVRLVEQTLLNVLSQSYPNIEYIVIDGGSTDGTADIIRRYESGLAYWVSEPDKGIYDAMNKGLQKATGDYVWFINATTTFLPSRIVTRERRDFCFASKDNKDIRSSHERQRDKSLTVFAICRSRRCS